MRQRAAMIQMVLVFCAPIAFCAKRSPGEHRIQMQASAKRVGKYEKLELLINIETQYSNPYDPGEVELTVLLKTPGGKQISLPAFYCQDYERRKLDQGRSRTNWYYPIGKGTWRARFAPMETGTYLAAARLKDRAGTTNSASAQFDCIPSSKKGFLVTSKRDPRFLEFTDGSPFFAIGQNLAFIGQSQYVNLTKAEEIFAKLSDNGANFLRIWTCCKDWAMAIEARKSAWGRSWAWNPPIVPIPGSEKEPAPRKCVKIEGDDGTSITASPSHPVALKPQTRYVLTGRFMADGPSRLRVSVGRGSDRPSFDAAAKDQWRTFRQEFVTGENEFWLGRVAFSLVGAGTIWLDKLSLKEAAGGAELLWEADVNRLTRGTYNQLDCFMLDQLLEAAERNGIYLMLCLITRDLYMKSLADDGSSEYQEAIDDVKKLMRYAVARWGYSTSVAAWEYFNEIDPGLPTDRFYTQVGRHLERIDVYRHLRTTSTWHPSAKDCHHPRLDIGQVHHYMRPETKEDFKDEVAVVLDRTRFLRKHAPSKPVLIGEFGLATPKWGLSEHMKQDSAAVHFHNSLWASAFAGNSGTAMFWWWDQLDRQDAYGHYQPLAAFLADVSFAGLRQLQATISNPQLRLLGYQGSDCAYIWVSNSQATWWNLVIDKKEPTQIRGVTIEVRDLRPGSYRVRWWHTYEGKIICEERVPLTNGVLRVSVPPFSRDIACKIRR